MNFKWQGCRLLLALCVEAAFVFIFSGNMQGERTQEHQIFPKYFRMGAIKKETTHPPRAFFVPGRLGESPGNVAQRLFGFRGRI